MSSLPSMSQKNWCLELGFKTLFWSWSDPKGLFSSILLYDVSLKLQNYELINACCLKPLSLWQYIMQK